MFSNNNNGSKDNNNKKRKTFSFSPINPNSDHYFSNHYLTWNLLNYLQSLHKNSHLDYQQVYISYENAISSIDNEEDKTRLWNSYQASNC